MKFELSIHAKRAVSNRKIPLEWIKQTLLKPQKVERHKEDPMLKQYWKEIREFDNRVLHVVINDNVDPIKVVTAHFDRGTRGKL